MSVYKYNGCGNTFVITDFKNGKDYSMEAISLCSSEQFDTDGLIVVKQNPLEMLLFNRDGSEAPMCGNGIRCFAKYVLDKGLTTEERFPVQTLAGEMNVDILQNEPFYCEVNIGRPDYSNHAFDAADDATYINRTISIDGEDVTFTSLFMGTVHTVVFVEDAVAMLETDLGEKLCQHPLFAHQTNVNFVQVLNREEIIVRTFERGVGWTLACGTGCSASFVVARDAGLVEDSVKVHLEQGTLTISGTEDIFMNGPAVFEYKK
ncbi:diaminopimelate epimerase [Desemzia sp. RIT804]|uniref:diaminopimelate epimerase n=1 Tax=Desemzia sp. RIT 804 TaxID=2810209 RepID=UPI00195064B5|nr:diaminopimelate epimerase [Desemzia sp. RIT 804]MBM6615882.1 diaminopimelate epimerase [Desemzia sp. RIT 804]